MNIFWSWASSLKDKKYIFFSPFSWATSTQAYCVFLPACMLFSHSATVGVARAPHMHAMFLLATDKPNDNQSLLYIGGGSSPPTVQEACFG